MISDMSEGGNAGGEGIGDERDIGGDPMVDEEDDKDTSDPPIDGSPWGKGSPGSEVPPKDKQSSCIRVIEDTEEKVEMASGFWGLMILCVGVWSRSSNDN